MKTLKLFSLMIALSLVLFSCEKETFDILIGSWDTSDGGEISFVADGTGTTTGSEFFEFDFGSGPIENFEWSLRDTADFSLLNMTFDDNAGGTAEFELPVDVIKKNEVYLGVEEFDLNVTLTR